MCEAGELSEVLADLDCALQRVHNNNNNNNVCNKSGTSDFRKFIQDSALTTEVASDCTACSGMEQLTASPTDALSQVPRPVTVGVAVVQLSAGLQMLATLLWLLQGQDVIQLHASPDHQFCPKVYHSTRCFPVIHAFVLLRSRYSLCLLFCRAFSAGQGNPYKLSVVPRSQVKGQQHWSISATGVCHIDSDHAAVFVPSGIGWCFCLCIYA